MRHITVFLLTFVLALPVLADTPRTLSYQGVLQDEIGAAIPDGDHEFVFTLWSAENGGVALWQETRSIATAQGLFDVVLGELVPIELSFDSVYWLAIAVDGEDLNPRSSLSAAPYALRAAVADSLAGGALDDGDWTEAGGDLHRLTGDVGIGTAAPAARLDVAGTIRSAGFQLIASPVLGHVLTSDAEGNASWQWPPEGGGLDLPFSGLADHDEAVFRADNQGTGPGLHGVSTSNSPGVLGNSPAGPGLSGTGVVGVRGQYADGNLGELGSSVAGVRGTAADADAAAVYGSHTPSGNEGSLGDASYGVFGQSPATAGRGVMGSNSAHQNWGYLGGQNGGVFGSATGSHSGVRGDHTSGNSGSLGTGTAGVAGTAATDGAGVMGSHPASGNEGWLGDAYYGVFGQSSTATGRGVMGSHGSHLNWGYLGGEEAGALGSAGGDQFGVKGQHTSGTWGYIGGPGAGGFFMHGNGNSVDLASEDQALLAFHNPSLSSAKLATWNRGVEGRAVGSSGVGVYARSEDGIALWAVTENGQAANFLGDVVIENARLGIGSDPLEKLHITTYNDNAVIRLQSGPSTVSGLGFHDNYSDSKWTLLFRTWQSDNLHIYDEELNDELMTFESNTGCVGIRNEDPAYPLDVNGIVRCASLIETSDRRLKRDVEPLAGSLEGVTRLRGVRYVWNDRAADLGARPGQEDIGLLAQEVEAVYPELVTTGEGGLKGVNYSKLTAVLIGAVQELKEQNDELARRVAELEEEVRRDR